MREHRAAQTKLIKQFLNWQDIFGATHLKCPNPAHADMHPSAFVYPNGIYCFGCGWRTLDIYEATRIYLGWTHHKARRELYSYISAHPPRGEKIKHNKPVPPEAVEKWIFQLHQEDVEYLREQYAIDEHVLAAAMIGHTGRAFSIPHLGLDGNTWAVKFRRDDRLKSDGPKYWSLENRSYHHHLYPAVALWHYLNTGMPKRILLCEGEFDCLSALSHGYAAVSVPAGNMTKLENWAWIWQEFADAEVVIYLCYDQDKPGRLAAQEAFSYFKTNHPTLLIIEACWEGAKDIAEYFNRGGKDLI